MPFVRGFLKVGRRGRPGRPDIGLPEEPDGGGTDPDYGIETGETEGNLNRATLFSLDPVTLKQKVIKELETKELAPQSPDQPGIRFSMAPDGKSFAYSTSYYREDLWMLTGYRQPCWRARLAEALHPK